MLLVALIIGSYLLGSIPFGKLFCQLGGVDIQKRGSGNIGFANVQRIMGWKYGIPTLAADISKGLAPTLIGIELGGVTVGFLLGTIAITGHVFPVWLKFKGGKGIATGLGVITALAPVVAVVAAGIYILCLRAGQVSSVASLAGVAIVVFSLPVALPSYWWMGIVCLIIPLFTLRDNFRGKVPDYG